MFARMRWMNCANCSICSGVNPLEQMRFHLLAVGVEIAHRITAARCQHQSFEPRIMLHGKPGNHSIAFQQRQLARGCGTGDAECFLDITLVDVAIAVMRKEYQHPHVAAGGAAHAVRQRLMQVSRDASVERLHLQYRTLHLHAAASFRSSATVHRCLPHPLPPATTPPIPGRHEQLRSFPDLRLLSAAHHNMTHIQLLYAIHICRACIHQSSNARVSPWNAGVWKRNAPLGVHCGITIEGRLETAS